MFLTFRFLLVPLVLSVAITVASPSINEVTKLRLAGDLYRAIDEAEQLLEVSNDPRDQIIIYLELAKIHDRIGLHQNSRPVAEALESILQAENLSADNDDLLLANLNLAYGDYYYRAEMPDRKFVRTICHLDDAILQFRADSDLHGEAEAVHRLGLVHLQQRKLESARELFDKSLRLDEMGGARVFFRGEYERHIGYVYEMSGDIEAALPHYAASLDARIEAGAIDASMFAAITLSSALLTQERLADAQEQLDYAMRVAIDIDSPAGKSRIERVQGKIDGAQAASEKHGN